MESNKIQSALEYQYSRLFQEYDEDHKILYKNIGGSIMLVN